MFLSEVSLQEEKVLTKQNTEKLKNLESDGRNRETEKTRDFYKECVEMSAELNKHWFKANSE